MSDKPDPVCSDCIGFLFADMDEKGRRRGRCGIRNELGMIPEELPYCDSFHVRRERAEAVKIPGRKARVAGSPRSSRPERPQVQRATLESPVRGDSEGEISMDRDGLKQVIREILEEETLYGYPQIGARWEGGTLSLKPADENLQAKDLPIEAFFHKIVMLRDRLRVLESKINGNGKLADGDKVELQAYISKCYGSLTTFNVLFDNKADQFSSK